MARAKQRATMMTAASLAATLAATLAAGAVAGPSAGAATASCPTETTIGGIDLGCLTDHLFVFADGRDDANWQSSSKGYVGDVAVDGVQADERTSGSFAFAGRIITNDDGVSKWDRIIDSNPGQASPVTGATAAIDDLEASLTDAIATIGGLTTTPGFENRSADSLDGLDTTGNGNQTTVIDVTDGLKVSSTITITGDPGDVFVLRWDTDGDAGNGLQGKVKFQSGGAIVPAGGLTPANFVHIAGDINASGGGDTPASPYPQGPRLDNGTGDLIEGAEDFKGGGFFTGYWLTTGDPGSGKTSSLSNAVFVGGWYTLSTKFSLTSGTSGVHVGPTHQAPPPSDYYMYD